MLDTDVIFMRFKTEILYLINNDESHNTREDPSGDTTVYYLAYDLTDSTGVSVHTVPHDRQG